jgi:hypothetical protein
MAAISRHHTMRRTWALAALPSVIGGPGSDFTTSGLPFAFWPT